MLNLSTKARMRYADNQKVLFKADLMLDTSNGRNPSIPVTDATGHNIANISPTYTSNYSGVISSGVLNKSKYTECIKSIPRDLLNKYRYLIISHERVYRSSSVNTFGFRIRIIKADGSYDFIQQSFDYTVGVPQRHNFVLDVRSIFSDPANTDFDYLFEFCTWGASVDFTESDIMLELNNTGVPSAYVSSSVYPNADFSKFYTTAMQLRGDDVMGDSATITDATSSSGGFDIGSNIINSFRITLNNFDDRFSLYDFTDAQIKVYVGIPLVDDVTNEDDPSQVEWKVKGYYIVDKPTSIGNTIPITMLDNMSRFERLLSDIPKIVYPSTLEYIVRHICLYCGVRVAKTIPFPSWRIDKDPSKDGMTCLDMIGYIAQISGCYARMNADGYLVFDWYNLSEFDGDTGVDLDGGTFLTKTTPYSDGDNVNGGSFDHSSESYVDEDGVTRVRYANPREDYDGGVFSWGNYGVLDSFTSFSVATEDIEILGIKVEFDNPDTEAENNKITYYYDKEGNIASDPAREQQRKEKLLEYCLEITDNALLPHVNQATLSNILNNLANRVCGIKIRPFDITGIAKFMYEAGDCVRIVSNKGDIYESVITSLSYPLNGYETFSCTAQTVKERKSVQSNPISSAISDAVGEANNIIRERLTEYDKEVKNLTSLSANALGFYETREINPLDGSIIDYMHDAPTLAESLNAYKKSASGFFVMHRNNVSEEWVSDAGVTMTGNAVYRYLTAKGISADWINTGSLKVGGLGSMQDGAINVYGVGTNEQGQQFEYSIGQWNKDGFKAIKGEIAGMTINERSLSAFGSKTFEGITLSANGSFGISRPHNNSWQGLFFGMAPPSSGGGTEQFPKCCTLFDGGDGDANFVVVHGSPNEGYWNPSSGWVNRTALAYDGLKIFQDSRYYMYYYGGSGLSQGSDVRLKQNIESLPKDKVRTFFAKVNPIQFEYIIGNDDSTHFGIIAQETQDALRESGLDSSSAISIRDDMDENDYLFVNYSEFHGIELAGIQDLYKIVNKQQEEIDLLKQEIELLKKNIQ